MISVNVVRSPCICTTVNGEIVAGDACVIAQSVSDSLIESKPLAIAHGTSILDEECSNRMSVSASGYLLGYFPPDAFCSLNDGYSSWPCVVDQIELQATMGKDSFAIETHLVFEREDI